MTKLIKWLPPNEPSLVVLAVDKTRERLNAWLVLRWDECSTMCVSRGYEIVEWTRASEGTPSAYPMAERQYESPTRYMEGALRPALQDRLLRFHREGVRRARPAIQPARFD